MKLESKVKAVKEQKSYGTLYLNSKDCPFLKDASIGDVVQMTVDVEITSLRAADQWEISDKKMGPKDITINANISKITEKKAVK